MRRLAPLAALALAAMAAPAVAAPDAACVAALKEMAQNHVTVPAFHSVVQDKQAGMTIEGIIIGDQIYAKMGTSWKKMSFKNNGRTAMNQFFNDRTNVMECRFGADDTVDGKAVQVIEVVQETKVEGLPDQGPIKMRYAFGKSDRLIYRMDSDNIVVNIRYENVTAPVK